MGVCTPDSERLRDRWIRGSFVLEGLLFVVYSSLCVLYVLCVVIRTNEYTVIQIDVYILYSVLRSRRLK